MSSKWLSIEVLDGPQTLQGKVAKVRLDEDPLSSFIAGIWRRKLGRLEFMQMYGDFTGLEKISRNHLSISHQGDRPGEFRLSDCGSTNGTEFPNGDTGKEVIAVLGGVLKIKLTQSLENFTITPDSFIVPAPRVSESGYSPPQVLDDESLMNLISSEIKKVCQKTGMSWQLRRGWNVREKPVEQSTLSDYQWKIIPTNGLPQYQQKKEPLISGERYESDFSEGMYYLVFVKNGELYFQHSGYYGGVLGHHWGCAHYVIQSGGWNETNITYYVDDFEISEWLIEWIDKYPPSAYSVT